MKALCIERRPDVGHLVNDLVMRELPMPEPAKGQVRIKLLASTITVDDQHIAEGTMFGGFPVAPRPSKTRPWIPGIDLVGIVHAVGPGIPGCSLGDIVFGMRPPKLSGPWAEYCITKASFVRKIPEHWSIEEAAALTLSGVVISSILAAIGPVDGKRCLVIGASGGLGTMLLPALKQAGATVWAVCSGKNRALVEALGAERVMDYTRSSFGAQLAKEGRCVHFSVDLLGGSQTQREALAVTHKKGCFVTVVGPEKHVGERRLSFLQLMTMLCKIGWTILESRFAGPRYRFVGPLAPDWKLLDRTIIARGLRPTIDHVVPFEEAAVRRALAYVASHRSRGRVVIKM